MFDKSVMLQTEFRNRYCEAMINFLNWKDRVDANLFAWTATTEVIKAWGETSNLVEEFNKAFKIKMPYDALKDCNCSHNLKDIVLRHCVAASMASEEKYIRRVRNIKSSTDMGEGEAILKGFTHISIYGDYIRLENVPAHSSQKPYDMRYVKRELGAIS